jgi:hypothetical protein
VWAPFDPSDVLLQNNYIEDTKPQTQIWSHHNPTLEKHLEKTPTIMKTKCPKQPEHFLGEEGQ